MFSEFIATFGLLSVMWGCSRLRTCVMPFAVGAYITAATSFANPAVTLARAERDTFSSIRPEDVPGFMVAQFAGDNGGNDSVQLDRPEPTRGCAKCSAPACD